MRPQILIAKGTGTSVDVLGANGELVARVNFFQHDNGGCTFDVIAQGQPLRVASWNNGKMTLNSDVDGKMVAVMLGAPNA